MRAVLDDAVPPRRPPSASSSGHRLAVDLVQLPRRDGRFVGGVVDPAVDAGRVQGAKQRLRDVGVVDHVQALMGGPLPGPVQRLAQVWVAVAVDESQSDHAHTQTADIEERALSLHLGLRVGAQTGSGTASSASVAGRPRPPG